MASEASEASEALVWWAIRFVLENYVWPEQRKDALKQRSDEICFAYGHIFGTVPRNLPIDFKYSWRRCLNSRCLLWYADELMSIYGFPSS